MKTNTMFKPAILVLGMMLSSPALLSASDHDTKNAGSASHENISKAKRHGKVVIANRASGSISIIDSKHDNVIATIALPPAAAPSQPMYVVHTPHSDRFFVGDRANNRVVVYDDATFELIGEVATGKGVFHMWADPEGEQLWVNNDIDNTVTVINPETLTVITTIVMPADIVANGGKPHDVLLDPEEDFAYVTFVGLNGASDMVVKFSSESFHEVARAEVGKDPHLSATSKNDVLYVPAQNNNAVYILSRDDLSLVSLLTIPGAHGAAIPKNGKTFYTTNISGGGTDGLYAISTRTNQIIGTPVSTQFATPHNIVLNRNGSKLYITHSGATSDKVTVYDIDSKTSQASFKQAITVGNNPFGLTFVK